MKVGDYVRTKYGIGKIDQTRYFMSKYEFHLDSNKGRIHNVTDNTYWNYETDIMGQPSDSPIDLIEVGDYVDGLKVIDIVEHLHGHKDIVMTNGKFQWSTSNDDYDIKSIVTKEQFSQMEYKVGE